MSANPKSSPNELEVKVKASIIKNFIAYTRWPLTDEQSPKNEKDKEARHLCVVGGDPYSSIFSRSPNLQVSSINFDLKQLVVDKTKSELKSCDILFIRLESAKEINRVVDMVSDLPILTISELPDNASLCMINFTYSEKRIAFSINRTFAKRAGIEFSSKMLRLASNIIGGGR